MTGRIGTLWREPISDQATLEGQIADERRKISALVSAVSVSQANIQGTEADVTRSAAAVDQARADVANAEQGVSRAQAEWTYANNNLHRIEPLLAKQFVTVDQVDRARTSEIAQAQALKQAESQLRLSQAGLQSTLAQEERSRAMLQQSKAQHEQAQNAVTTLEPLINQRGARASAIETARYNLNNCRVYAPFAARVTNLTISEGAYAHVGQQVFTLIDARTWWAVANFREGQLQHIAPGMRADVYVMSKPNVRFSGVVDSIGFGVTPDADVIRPFGAGLARCAADPELGAPGLPLSGACPRGESSRRSVSSKRVGRRRHSRTLKMATPRANRAEVDRATHLVLGISQRGTHSIPRPAGNSHPHGARGHPRHADLRDISYSLWISGRGLRTLHHSRESSSHTPVGT